ncbi:PREDICTED: sugar transporter ERD6-like 18 isoform X1 [Camelina sativa]|uniref:Sugar transporter ERD6-like 18 isoform X1 n=3 Tax=Camelina sativa TaxID=90675 RepID=A0ABM0T6K2_CAMSA|nr:PREDICTED: sugar transporter ERD6-like 18 isoform X1 [Camelina sativa]
MMVVEEERSIEEQLLHLNDQNDDSGCRVTACVILSTLVAVCGSFSFGVAMGYTSAAEIGIMKDLGLSIAQFSAFGSFNTLGSAIGALFSGKMAMSLGRRRTMWVSDILCIIGWFSIALAKDAMWLNIGRISSGIGLGLISYVVPVYIAEVSPKHVRGTFTFTNQILQNCGLAMVYFSGNYINWRTLALIGVLPCFIQAIGLFFVPESPRWLAKVGTDTELENSLLRLRGRDADISREASEIQVVTKMVENDSSSRSTFCDLFQRKYSYTLVVGIGLMLVQQFSGSSAVVAYASTIFRKSGFSVALGSTLLGFFMIPKAMIGVILVDKWGRRPLLLTSASGMSISSILIGIAFTLQKMKLLPNLTPIFTFICLMLYIGTFAIGLGGLPWVTMSEIFPINIKVTAGSIVTLVSFSSSSMVTYAFNFLFEWSTQGTFYIFGGIAGAALLFIWLLVPETKGLSLEEIQTKFIHQPNETNQT